MLLSLSVRKRISLSSLATRIAAGDFFFVFFHSSRNIKPSHSITENKLKRLPEKRKKNCADKKKMYGENYTRETQETMFRVGVEEYGKLNPVGGIVQMIEAGGWTG